MECRRAETRGWITAILLLWLPMCEADVYGSGWYREIQASVGHEANISRSIYSPDEESDNFASLSIGGGHSRKLEQNSQLVLYGYLAVKRHNEFDGLDHLAVTLGATITHQFTPAFDAPWYTADFRATALRYNDSDAREGVLFNGDLSVNRRLGTRAAWHLGYRYHDLLFVGKSSAEENQDAAFDTFSHEVYLGMNYQLMQHLIMYGEYAFRYGSIWSNNRNQPNPIYDRRSIDQVFDDCKPDMPGCQPRYAGRIKSDVHRVNVGISFPIKQFDIDISAVYYEAKGDNGRRYRGQRVTAGLIWYF